MRRSTSSATARSTADEVAFGKVAAAYQLPRQTPEEKEARSAAIAESTGGAARPPADLMAASVRLVGLAEELLPVANKNVISDIAAASAAITAAAITARVNIEANLPGIRDEGLAAELKATAELADGVADRADRVVTAVREEISR
jgi:formiminotetrahydrofolate cyclodeaminase